MLLLPILITLLSCCVVPVLYFKTVTSLYTSLISEAINKTDLHYFKSVIILYLLSYFVMNIYNVVHAYIATFAISSIHKRIYMKIFHIISNTDLFKFKDSKRYSNLVGKNMSILYSILRSLFIIWIPSILDIVVTVFYVVYLGNTKLMFFVMFWVISQFLFLYLFVRKSMYLRESSASVVKINLVISENILNAPINKIYNLSSWHHSHVEKTTKDVMHAHRNTMVMTYIVRFFIQMYSIIFACCMVYFAYVSDICVEQRSKLNIIVFNTVRDINKFFNFIIPTIDSINMKDLYAILYDVPQEKCSGKIILEKLQYIKIDRIKANNKYIDLNISIESGIYMIRGPNGIGKTRFINKLSGLYCHNDADDFYYNGHHINEVNSFSIRKHVLMMTQSDYIYHISLVKNIILNAKFDQDVYNLVAHESGLSKIHSRCKTLNVDSLSGGQRKLISIARMMYKFYLNDDKKWLFIMDEPFNNLDKRSSSALNRFIKKVASKNIVLIVDHSNIITVDDKFVINMSK